MGTIKATLEEMEQGKELTDDRDAEVFNISRY